MREYAGNADGRAYPDHSIYSETSTGQSDLRSILRAYSNFATGGYRSEMALVAGMLLIHCVAEDAFWLFAGFVNGVLREYYASPSAVRDQPSDKRSKATGLKVDAGVFVGVLWGSEPKLGRLFKDLGIHRECDARKRADDSRCVSRTMVDAAVYSVFALAYSAARD